jgi:signal transduction histidine kinase
MSSPPSDPTPGKRGPLRRVLDLGARSDETDSTRISRVALLIGALLMSGGGVLWGTLALWNGRVLASVIPYGYVVLTAINLSLFSLTRDFSRARFLQVLVSLALPFAFQWSLGGFAASGAVMIWAMVSIMGALTLSTARDTALWLAFYCTLTVVSGALDPVLVEWAAFRPSETLRTLFLVTNIVTVSGVVFGLAIFLNHGRSRAIRSLEQASAEIALLNGQLAREVDEGAAQLAELRALQGALSERSGELEASLRQLRETQDELISREKHAALGQLVAGVAHEVNTPLGVSYTAVTLGIEHVDALADALGGAAPSRKRALELIESTREALRVAQSNAERASKLIASFKSVAADQTSEAERRVELLGYLEGVVSSLRPMLRREQVEVRCEGDPVELHTRPGAIAQVVTNLVQNAAMHAFAPDEEDRVVAVRCRPEGEHAVVEVEDHGVGMSPELAKRAFEPFVTTKRGRGGTGLGLHIAHQQVYEVLGGSLELHTQPGRGTRMTIRIPLEPTRSGRRPSTLDELLAQPS